MKSKLEIINEHFFRPRWYSILINPYFIDRRTLLKAVKNFSRSVKKEDKVLDVGCGIKPYREFFPAEQYIGIDIDGGGHSNKAKEVDKYYDGREIPFSDNYFDVILCTQVLEHAQKPDILIREMFRVMKKDATIFLSVPFVGNEHEQPYDFWRFTQFSLKELLSENGFKNIKVFPSCGFFSTAGQMLTSFIFESIKIRSSFLKLILSIFILAPIQVIFIVLDRLFPNKRLTLNYVIKAKK